MRKMITEKLNDIEKEKDIKILLAVESGSRAWGFASPDSDYDVRFIYCRRKNDYLKLEKTRDVIELPINDELDINGWDMQKALRLLYRSNPTLFEWLSSPIVYAQTPFADQLRQIAPAYFSKKKSLYHYLSMAEGNYREYLKGETVRAKKYFYVLRPVLACRWIMEKNTPPPMLFSELAEAELPYNIRDDVTRLLYLKINSPEIKEIPRIGIINDFLDEQINEIKTRLNEIKEDKSNEWEDLNKFFLSAIS